MSVNKAIILGNAGRDPELRTIGNAANEQVNVAEFSVATTERRRTATGQIEENTEWHNIVCFRQLADIVKKYVHKGDQVYIEGKMRTRSWQDKNGQTHYRAEILAEKIDFVGRRSEQQDRQPQQADQRGPQPYSFMQQGEPDNDLPFL